MAFLGRVGGKSGDWGSLPDPCAPRCRRASLAPVQIFLTRRVSRLFRSGNGGHLRGAAQAEPPSGLEDHWSVEGRPWGDNFPQFSATAPAGSLELLELNIFRACSVDLRAFWAFSDEPGFANHPIAIVCGGATIRTTTGIAATDRNRKVQLFPPVRRRLNARDPGRGGRPGIATCAPRRVLLASAAARTPERVRPTAPTERSASVRTGRFNNPRNPNPSSLHDWSPES
jgi:hypothetical protein